MSDTWKAVERAIAHLLGGRRVPVSGRQRGDSPDIEHPFLSIEVKHRKQPPAWLLDALDQAHASTHGCQHPIAVLHERYRPYKKSLVVLTLEDFIAIYNACPLDHQLAPPPPEEP